MSEEKVNPETFTREQVYELVKQYVIKELKSRNIELHRASEMAKSILEHLEINLEQMTPFDALMYLTKDYPELLDATLLEREYLWHEQDIEKVNYIKACLQNNDMEAIAKLNQNITQQNG